MEIQCNSFDSLLTIKTLRLGNDLPIPTHSEGGRWGNHCHLEQRGGRAQAQGGAVCHEGWASKNIRTVFFWVHLNDVLAVGGHMEDGGHDGDGAVHEGG